MLSIAAAAAGAGAAVADAPGASVFIPAQIPPADVGAGVEELPCWKPDQMPEPEE